MDAGSVESLFAGYPDVRLRLVSQCAYEPGRDGVSDAGTPASDRTDDRRRRPPAGGVSTSASGRSVRRRPPDRVRHARRLQFRRRGRGGLHPRGRPLFQTQLFDVPQRSLSGGGSRQDPPAGLQLPCDLSGESDQSGSRRNQIVAETADRLVASASCGGGRVFYGGKVRMRSGTQGCGEEIEDPFSHAAVGGRAEPGDQCDANRYRAGAR